MRKALPLLLIFSLALILLSGCGNKTAGEKEKQSIENDAKKFSIEQSADTVDLDDDTGRADLVIDENLAFEIGNAALEATYDNDVLLGTECVLTDYSEQDVYVVSRFKEGELGGDFNVAICKKDGAILRIWAGE